MYSVEVPKAINLIFESLYRLGLWHRQDPPTAKGTRIKLFYSIYYFFFPATLFTAALTTDDKDEFIFLLQVGTAAVVLFLKLFYLTWSKREILQLTNRIGVYSLEDCEQFALANKKLQSLNKMTKILILIIYSTDISCAFILPFIGSKKTLFVNIAFPLDWRNDELAFWVAFVFLTLEIFISCVAFLLSVLSWYLMISCALRYQILGLQIINLGVRRTSNKLTTSRTMKEKLFRQDLITAIHSYADIKEYINVTITNLLMRSRILIFRRAGQLLNWTHSCRMFLLHRLLPVAFAYVVQFTVWFS